MIDSETTFEISKIFGHSKLKQFSRIENGRLQFYGYRTDYDVNGKEIGRTEPGKLGAIGWDDDSPFTEQDALTYAL